MKLSSSLLFLLLPVIAYTQTDDYRLDSYLNPDYNRKELNFDFGASTQLSSNKSKSEVGGIETSNYEAKRKSFNSDLNTGFYQIANSVKKQTTTNLYLNILGNYLNDNNGIIKNKDFGLNINFHQLGYYYVKDKKFIEFSPNGNFYYNTSRRNNLEPWASSIIKEKYNNTNANLSFKLGVGKGRIEQVEDAYLAMYILSDLKNNGSLKKVLSPDEVNMLAQQITSTKNKRRFDSRVKLIEEISTVDSFLIANGYTDSEKTVPFFTSLYDNWLYAGLFERATGSRFSVGVSPIYSWSHNKEITIPAYNDNNRYYSETSMSVYMSYRYEKPVNLYLQHSVYTDISGMWRKTRNENEGSIGPSVSGQYSFGYYPNTRTHILSSCFLNYYSMHNEDYDNYFLRSGLRLDLYYYLSPQLRLSADSGLTYYSNKVKQQNQTSTNKYPDFSFNLGLQYSIF